MAMEDLKILAKVEELNTYTHQALIQFPKYEKFVLCAEIRQTVSNIIHAVIRSAKKYHKKTTLQDTDIEIEYLRSLIRKSFALQYINIHRYEVWMSHVNEIGKMLGGWIKAA